MLIFKLVLFWWILTILKSAFPNLNFRMSLSISIKNNNKTPCWYQLDHDEHTDQSGEDRTSHHHRVLQPMSTGISPFTYVQFISFVWSNSFLWLLPFTNYHKLSDLKQQWFIFLKSWRPEVLSESRSVKWGCLAGPRLPFRGRGPPFRLLEAPSTTLASLGSRAPLLYSQPAAWCLICLGHALSISHKDTYDGKALKSFITSAAWRQFFHLVNASSVIPTPQSPGDICLCLQTFSVVTPWRVEGWGRWGRGTLLYSWDRGMQF